jgi:hypothetical protein
MTYRPVLHVHSGWKLHNQIKKLECHLHGEWQPSGHARHEHDRAAISREKGELLVYTVVNRVSQEILPYGNDLASRKTLMHGTRRESAKTFWFVDQQQVSRSLKAQNVLGC